MKTRYLIGGLIAIAFLAFGLYSLDSSKIDYVNIESAKATDRKVQVKGVWLKEKGANYDNIANIFTFTMTDADIMIIGEAPGADEDEQGLPFVGAAGQLLTKILAAVNFNRDEVYIANILKCRPPGNRRPEKLETDACEPYLHRQIEIVRPKFILALGLTAANTLLKSQHKMGDIRGKIFSYRGVHTLVTYHPAALLRNPNWKVNVWEDVKLLRKMYDAWKNGDVNPAI